MTAILSGAFKGCDKMTQLTIGKNVKTIPKNLCKGKKKLKTVIVKSKVLSKVGSAAFKNMAKKAKIQLPKKVKTKYQKLFTKKVRGEASLKWK